ncbi:MAG: hypothetical protein WDW36_007127 [Sanguina aurantia]
MFYSTQIIAKGGILQVVWTAAHMDRQLRRQAVQDVSIETSVRTILANVDHHSGRPAKRQRREGGDGSDGGGGGGGGGGASGAEGEGALLALRLSGQLMLGVARLYSRKTLYLQQVGGCVRPLCRLPPPRAPLNVDCSGAQHTPCLSYAPARMPTIHPPLPPPRSGPQDCESAVAVMRQYVVTAAAVVGSGSDSDDDDEGDGDTTQPDGPASPRDTAAGRARPPRLAPRAGTKARANKVAAVVSREEDGMGGVGGVYGGRASLLEAVAAGRAGREGGPAGGRGGLAASELHRALSQPPGPQWDGSHGHPEGGRHGAREAGGGGHGEDEETFEVPEHFEFDLDWEQEDLEALRMGGSQLYSTSTATAPRATPSSQQQVQREGEQESQQESQQQQQDMGFDLHLGQDPECSSYPPTQDLNPAPSAHARGAQHHSSPGLPTHPAGADAAANEAADQGWHGRAGGRRSGVQLAEAEAGAPDQYAFPGPVSPDPAAAGVSGGGHGGGDGGGGGGADSWGGGASSGGGGADGWMGGGEDDDVSTGAARAPASPAGDDAGMDIDAAAAAAAAAQAGPSSPSQRQRAGQASLPTTPDATRPSPSTQQLPLGSSVSAAARNNAGHHAPPNPGSHPAAAHNTPAHVPDVHRQAGWPHSVENGDDDASYNPADGDDAGCAVGGAATHARSPRTPAGGIRKATVQLDIQRASGSRTRMPMQKPPSRDGTGAGNNASIRSSMSRFFAESDSLLPAHPEDEDEPASGIVAAMDLESARIRALLQDRSTLLDRMRTARARAGPAAAAAAAAAAARLAYGSDLLRSASGNNINSGSGGARSHAHSRAHPPLRLRVRLAGAEVVADRRVLGAAGVSPTLQYLLQYVSNRSGGAVRGVGAGVAAAAAACRAYDPKGLMRHPADHDAGPEAAVADGGDAEDAQAGGGCAQDEGGPGGLAAAAPEKVKQQQQQRKRQRPLSPHEQQQRQQQEENAHADGRGQPPREEGQGLGAEMGGAGMGRMGQEFDDTDDGMDQHHDYDDAGSHGTYGPQGTGSPPRTNRDSHHTGSGNVNGGRNDNGKENAGGPTPQKQDRDAGGSDHASQPFASDGNAGGGGGGGGGGGFVTASYHTTQTLGQTRSHGGQGPGMEAGFTERTHAVWGRLCLCRTQLRQRRERAGGGARYARAPGNKGRWRGRQLRERRGGLACHSQEHTGLSRVPCSALLTRYPRQGFTTTSGPIPYHNPNSQSQQQLQQRSQSQQHPHTQNTLDTPTTVNKTRSRLAGDGFPVTPGSSSQPFPWGGDVSGAGDDSYGGGGQDGGSQGIVMLSRLDAGRTFFELLVLSNRGFVVLEQGLPYAELGVELLEA